MRQSKRTLLRRRPVPAPWQGFVSQARQPGQFTMAFTYHELSNRNGVSIGNTAQGCSVTFSNPAVVALSGQGTTRGVWVGWWPMVGLGAAAVAYSLLRRRRIL